MLEGDKFLEKELDRLLVRPISEEPCTPIDSVCMLSIEIDKGKTIRPLSSEQELALALRQDPSAKDEKTKYGEDLYKASKSLEKDFRMEEAEKVLEKLVIFDEKSNCFEGTASEHLFHLALNEEFQGKFAEAETHYRKGLEETKQERLSRLEDDDFAPKRHRKEAPQQIDDEVLDNVPLRMRKAENYAALARLANRRGFAQEASELLTQAYIKDSDNGGFLKKAADPKNFNDLYFDWLYTFSKRLLKK